MTSGAFVVTGLETSGVFVFTVIIEVSVTLYAFGANEGINFDVEVSGLFEDTVEVSVVSGALVDLTVEPTVVLTDGSSNAGLNPGCFLDLSIYFTSPNASSVSCFR